MQKLRMSVLQKIFALLANFIDVLLKKIQRKKEHFANWSKQIIILKAIF